MRQEPAVKSPPREAALIDVEQSRHSDAGGKDGLVGINERKTSHFNDKVKEAKPRVSAEYDDSNSLEVASVQVSNQQSEQQESE